MRTFFSLLTPLLLLTGLLTGWETQAQKPLDDVLYLRNGWILRGRLLSTPSDSVVSIQTYDHNRFVFPRDQVQSLTREPAKNPSSLRYRERGYGLFAELGALAARNTTADAVTTSAFTFHIVNGYKFNQWLYAGLGTGVDLYATQTFVPVFGSLRGDFTRTGGVIPFYFADGGYGFNATVNNSQSLRYGGGAYASAGAGLKILFQGNSGFLVSVGYYLQRSTITQTTAGTSTRQEVDYNRIAIRAGFSL